MTSGPGLVDRALISAMCAVLGPPEISGKRQEVLLWGIVLAGFAGYALVLFSFVYD